MISERNQIHAPDSVENHGLTHRFETHGLVEQQGFGVRHTDMEHHLLPRMFFHHELYQHLTQTFPTEGFVDEECIYEEAVLVFCNAETTSHSNNLVIHHHEVEKLCIQKFGLEHISQVGRRILLHLQTEFTVPLNLISIQLHPKFNAPIKDFWFFVQRETVHSTK